MSDNGKFQKKHSVKQTNQQWNLRFLNKEMEQKYQESKRTVQDTLFSLLLSAGFLLGILNLLWHLIYKLPFRWVITGPVLLFVLLPGFVFVLARTLPKFLREPLILIYILCFLLGSFEADFAQRNDSGEINGEYFMIEHRAMLIIIMIFSRVSWTFSFIALIVSDMLWTFRYNQNIKEASPFIICEILGTLFKILVLGLISYKLENLDRLRFKERLNYETSITSFEELVKEDFPSALMIFSEDQILFNNLEAEKMFKISKGESESLLGTLKQIVIDGRETEKVISNLDERNLNIEDNIDRISFTRPKEGRPRYSIENRRTILKDNSLYTILQSNEGFSDCTVRNIKSGVAKLYCIYDKGNSEVNLEIRLKEIIWQNKEAIMILITESRILGKLKRSKEQGIYKDHLLATVSHDLRTPLNGITGMILSALEEINDKQIRKNLTLALRSAKLLLLMINDILDFSQISNGKLRLNFESFDLWDAINDISKLIKFQAKQKGVKFLAENLTGSPKTVIYNDQNRLKQVLLNLLGNALKFTQKGQIKITLEKAIAQGEAAAEREFKISVEDTGIGIKQEDIPKLFKLFGKLENNEGLNKNGVGLGLAISQKLVKSLNKKAGKIGVSSEYGRGSCFFFPLFSQESPEDSIEYVHESAELSVDEDFFTKMEVIHRDFLKPEKGTQADYIVEEERKKIKVLVVDDDQLNIKVASSYLKKSGKFSFDVAFNGAEALEIVKRKAAEDYFYDVILMDCNMPVMDGFQATGVIRTMINNKQLRDVEIIACTANASEEDYQKCYRSGMADFISKPFSREAMQNKIHKVLSKRK